MKRRCFSSIIPETPLSVNRKRGFSCISPHFPALPLVGRPFGEKTTFFFANAKVPPRVFKIFTALRFTPSLSLQVFLSRPADGGAGKKYDAAPEPPFPAVGGEGRAKKRENTESGSETKREGRGQKSAARAVRRKAMRVGKRKKRREKAEAPPKVLGAPLPKKNVAADGKTTRKKRHKGQVLQKPLRQTKLFVSRTLRQARFCSGNREKRAGKAFATGQSVRTQQKSPKRRFGLFLRGRTDADPCKRRLLNALPRGRGFPSPDRRGKSRRCSPETPPFFTVIFTVCHRVF